MLRLTESGPQKNRYLNRPPYRTLMNFQRRLRTPNITKLVRRSFRPFDPDVARRCRNHISESHKSRKIDTGKIADKKKNKKKKKKKIENHEKKRKGEKK